jgi:transposase
LTRGWFRKGSKPSIKCIHTKKRRSVFGALSKDEFSSQFTEEKCNFQTWLQFLKSLLRKYGKILIVVDGAKYHFEKEHIQKFYKNNRHRLVVIQLPPYSPKLNPIEQVWKKIKKWLAITPWSTEKEFEMKLVSALNNSDLKVKMFDYYCP